MADANLSPYYRPCLFSLLPESETLTLRVRRRPDPSGSGRTLAYHAACPGSIPRLGGVNTRLAHTVAQFRSHFEYLN